MPIRFIDSNFFKSPFVRSLKGPLKSLYTFIICDCDGSGIWTKDLPIASAYIDFEITEKDFNIFIETGKAIDLKNGKYFFPDFIEHQYPQGLQDKNPAHKNFVLTLKKYNLIDEDLKVLQRSLEAPYVTVKVTVKEKVMVKEKVNGPENELFFPFNSNEFLNAWNILVKEKKWRKKSQSALQASLKILSNYTEFEAIKMIEAAIAGEWQGIHELKIHNGSTKQNPGEERVGRLSKSQIEKFLNTRSSPGSE